MSTEKEKLETLINEIKDLISEDKALREKHQIGERFRFVKDRLNAILDSLEKSLPIVTQAEKKSSQEITSGDAIVYVYLYNAHGLQFKTWQNMLNPKVFYEYSVNRPIYAEKSFIDSLLRTKANKQQHGYLMVAVKKEMILPATEEMKDVIGNPVIKVKEGSLKIEKLISFVHNEQQYVLNEKGELVKPRNGS